MESIQKSPYYKYTNSSKADVYFTLTVHLNSEAKFSEEILDPHLDFIKCAVKTGESQNQVAYS